MFFFEGRNHQAARIAWWFWIGSWPGEKNVCHTCDNPMCVRPEHLFLGTDLDNKRDCVSKGRAKHLNASGSLHPKSKLTRKKIQECKELRASGWKWKDLSAKFGVHYTTLIHAIKGDNWNRGDSYSFDSIKS
jgi:hypothetical protein